MRDELLTFIRQWRIYRAWQTDDARMAAHYTRLANDYATIIRERLRGYDH